MIKNIGSVDRYIRIILGIGIVILGIVATSWWGLIGVALLVTAGVDFCPVYAALGLTTRKKISSK